MMEGLWGEEFVLPEKPKVKKILDKATKETKRSSETKSEKVEKVTKSKKISFADKVKIIEESVNNILGKQADNTIVIYNKDELHSYIQKGLRYGRLSIDTETNNSLDPITCKLMGLCLYVKGEKQAYIPVNHVNPESLERLDIQLNEQDIHDELEYLVNNKGACKFVFHNAKFDYQVLKCTVNVKLPIDWDTLIGAKLLDENEKSAGLKQQYISKIDPDQEKYSIDNLFQNLEYALFTPELFALYAATDAMMTDRLYEWQMKRFEDPSLSRVLKLALTKEMPLIEVVADMENYGVEFDKDYAQVLHNKYHSKLERIDKEIDIELDNLKDKILAWRISPEANVKPLNKKGDGQGKSKNEQLTDPINLGSPTQLAILFYDVLKCPVVSKKSPRGTGEDELKALSQKMKLKLFDKLLERRAVVKLLDSFIDSLPEEVNIDGRIHCKFNQYGAATGRFSSSEPNLQQIPSHNLEIRMLFRGRTIDSDVDCSDNVITVSKYDYVLSNTSYIPVTSLVVGDPLTIDYEDGTTKIEQIKSITIYNDDVVISF